MKTILLPFHDDAVDTAALDISLLLAKCFDSYIEGLFVWQPPQIIAGAGEGITLYGDYVSQVAAEGQQLAAQAKAQFHELMRQRGVTVTSESPPGEADSEAHVERSERISAGWYEGEGLEDRIVGDYGRVFDVIVIGRSSQPSSGDWETTCEAALFESGRPVILSPAQAPTTLGERVLIAWNGSTETARTIALGLPLLYQAQRVTVLTVEGGTVAGPSGQQVAGYLQRHGINASAKTVPETDSIGATILQQAQALDADLLIKGAYTQSRLRQLIFGGATRHIINHAELPVLLAH